MNFTNEPLSADCKSARQIHFLARTPRRLFKSPPHWARSGKIGVSGGGSVGQGKSRSSNRKHEPVFRPNRLCSAFCEGYGHKKQGQRRSVVLFGSGRRTRTTDLRVMSPSIPRCWTAKVSIIFKLTKDFWKYFCLPPGETDEKPYFRNSRIASTPSLGKLRCSPVTRFFMFTVPDAISDSPVIERKGIERLSAYSNCFFSFAASG